MTLVDKRPDQCQRCGTLGADGNRMEPGATRWRCGRCGNSWTTQESPMPAITLADVRAHIKRRITLRRELAASGILNSGVNADVCTELTEILAMLDRVRGGGAGSSDPDQCSNCGSRSVTRAFPVDRPMYLICDDCKRSWRPKPLGDVSVADDKPEPGDVTRCHACPCPKMQARLERAERALVELGSTVVGLINQAAPDPAYFAGPWKERLNAIRQDLAEIDRNQPPKE